MVWRHGVHSGTCYARASAPLRCLGLSRPSPGFPSQRRPCGVTSLQNSPRIAGVLVLSKRVRLADRRRGARTCRSSCPGLARAFMVGARTRLDVGLCVRSPDGNPHRLSLDHGVQFEPHGKRRRPGVYFVIASMIGVSSPCPLAGLCRIYWNFGPLFLPDSLAGKPRVASGRRTR